MVKYAIVSLQRDNAEQVCRYLPDNYFKIGYAPHDKEAEDLRRSGPCLVVAGEDHAGWTLVDYVLPRLASGLISAQQIGADDAILRELGWRVPEDATLVNLPYSEVCMHMRVAGTTMWVVPRGENGAQLYDLEGRRFSAPILRSEAGLSS